MAVSTIACDSNTAALVRCTTEPSLGFILVVPVAVAVVVVAVVVVLVPVVLGRW